MLAFSGAGETARFDMKMIEALPQHSFTTSTPWFDKPIPVRENGPLFVVCPFDSSAGLRSSTCYERSIWQRKAVDIP